MITTKQIFASLADGWPDCSYSLPNDYKDFDSQVIWHNPDVKHPALSDIEEHYKLIAYKDERQACYPFLEDQLDLLYNVGYDGWRKVIDEIKQKYPKP